MEGTSPLSRLNSFKMGNRACSVAHKQEKLPPLPLPRLACLTFRVNVSLERRWGSSERRVWNTQNKSLCEGQAAWAISGECAVSGLQGLWGADFSKKCGQPRPPRADLPSSESGRSPTNINEKWTKGDVSFTWEVSQNNQVGITSILSHEYGFCKTKG